VTTYFTNAETRFSHRTRFLDYIWARLPLVCTAGDVLADEVAAKTWGVAVPAQDEEALVAALEKVLFDDAFAARARRNLNRAAKELTWEAAFTALVQRLQEKRVEAVDGRRARRLAILRAGAAYLIARLVEKLVARVSGAKNLATN
jgi:hypothetical protein